jgi:putative transposase
MDGQSVKTTERGGIRGFDAHKRVKGRKRHILVDTFGLLIACRVEPADISDRKAAALLLGGLRPLFPNIRTVIADAGHQSAELAHHLLRQDGWKAADRQTPASACSRSQASPGLWSGDKRYDGPPRLNKSSRGTQL